MTARASPAGWVVQVTNTQPSPAGPHWTNHDVPAPSFRYFDAAIADPEKAVEAVQKHLAKAKVDPNDGQPRAVRALSPVEVAALQLKAGEVKPA